MHHDMSDRATILPPEGDRDTDPGESPYYSEAPPPVPLDDDERAMLAAWEAGR